MEDLDIKEIEHNFLCRIIIVRLLGSLFHLEEVSKLAVFFSLLFDKTLGFLISPLVLCIYFFNFPYFDGGSFGGGFFHKLSNILFKNNFLLYFIFIISLITIYLILFKEKKLNNLILLIMLILSNPQFTIYNKYFDPLIFIIFLTLFEFDIKKHFFEKKYRYFQIYFISISYLVMALLKPYVL